MMSPRKSRSATLVVELGRAMAFYLASACFLVGLILLFWLPRRPKQIGVAVGVLWAVATLLRTTLLLPR
jgi:FtsH-binding integral membrane protein